MNKLRASFPLRLALFALLCVLSAVICFRVGLPSGVLPSLFGATFTLLLLCWRVA